MHDFAGHEHEHLHENITAFDSKAQAVALVSYMLEHNKAHTEELHEICHKLEASGDGCDGYGGSGLWRKNYDSGQDNAGK